jgi:hypothetical protein
MFAERGQAHVIRICSGFRECPRKRRFEETGRVTGYHHRVQLLLADFLGKSFWNKPAIDGNNACHCYTRQPPGVLSDGFEIHWTLCVIARLANIYSDFFH